jgi:hypothetical protein
MQGIHVTALECGKPSIKGIIDGLSPIHHNIAWQKTIKAAHPRPRITLNATIKMHYLPERMHSGIGSPSSSNSDGIGARLGIANESIDGLL